MDESYKQRFYGKSSLQSPVKSSYSTPNKIPIENVYHDRYIPVRTTGAWKETQNEHYRLVSKNDNEENVMEHQYQSINNSNIATENQSPTENAFCELVSSVVSSNTNNSHNYEAQYDYSSVLYTPKNLNSFTYKQVLENPNKYKYDESSLTDSARRILSRSRTHTRKIPTLPYKVLDAPNLQDDFYLNLIDWSCQDILAVGIEKSVHIWNTNSSHTLCMCDYSNNNDMITSVAWSENGTHLAVGTYQGTIQVWDLTAEAAVRTIYGHRHRVSSLDWNVDLLASGSRDQEIHLTDVRAKDIHPLSFKNHSQEVCGLKWSTDKVHLASGSNDNKVMVWKLTGQSGCGSSDVGMRATGGLEPLEPIPKISIHDIIENASESSSGFRPPSLLPMSKPTTSSSSSSHSINPIIVYDKHVAAVKALAWSPHQHGLLASGGGTRDSCIKFWDALTGNTLHSVDTGSQVCNIAWSPHANELVSTHGYSKNQIMVWQYQDECKPLAKLTGHPCRVLYLALNPDGSEIVTGAGDETLRFWNVFEKQKFRKIIKPERSTLDIFGGMR